MPSLRGGPCLASLVWGVPVSDATGDYNVTNN